MSVTARPTTSIAHAITDDARPASDQFRVLARQHPVATGDQRDVRAVRLVRVGELSPVTPDPMTTSRSGNAAGRRAGAR